MSEYKVYVGFSSSKNIMSRLARWLTKSEYSHVYLFFDTPFEKKIILHATVGGIQTTIYDKWKKKQNQICEFEIVPDVKESLIKSMELVGKKYDYIGYLGFIPVLLFRWFGKKIKNIFASPKSLVCSELVLYLRENNAIPEWQGLDLEATTPQDMYVRCKDGKSFKLIGVEKF